MGATTLRLARGVYALLGIGTLLVAISETFGDLSSGCRLALTQAEMDLAETEQCVVFLDLPFTGAMALLGLLALAAAAWVTAPDRLRATVAWLGIGAGVAAFVIPMWLVVAEPTSRADVYTLAAIPLVVGLAAAARLAAARIGRRRAT